jgi:hypothetical protein
MKKGTYSNGSHGAGAPGKNGRTSEAGATRRVKRPDFLANLERLGYSEKIGTRMIEKFHDSIS